MLKNKGKIFNKKGENSLFFTKHKIDNDSSLEEFDDEVRKYSPKHIIFTGGEPLLQNEFIKKYVNKTKDFKFSIETNGTLFQKINLDTFVISPKKQKINIDALKEYSKFNNTYFKFVYESAKDKWWEQVIKDANLPLDRVYIMPEGKKRGEQIKKMPEVIQYCLDNNYKFGIRSHVLAFNQKRRV